MATDNKSSILVDELLPEFLETEGPKFKSFVRAYYEFLETTGQLTERSKNLLNYADIDKTNTEFVKYFEREILANFPQEILTNKKLVAARIKELYRAKGSEQAYKMLFRMLFDDEISFYYPGQDILRVSDGRWVQENSLRLSAPFTGNLFAIGGRVVIGQSSGATAIVERVQKTFEQGIEVFEIFISDIRGTFQDSEIVETDEGDLSGVVLSSVGPLEDVIVSFGGSAHRAGDLVTFSSISGAGATGVVIKVEDSSILPVVIDGGSGYSVNAIITIAGGSGSGAQFKVDTLSNTEVLFTFEDIIAGLENTVIQANTFGSSNSATISANLAISTFNTVLNAALGTSPLTVGSIASMSAITRGSGFANNALPTVTAIEPGIAEQFLNDGSGGIKGLNANLSSQLIGGSIISVDVDLFGLGYARNDPVTITNITRNAQNAIGAAQVTGIIEYPGKYIDTKGFLSWNNKLQDNLFYQQFSYVIRSQQNVDAYREIVKKLLHPAGTNLFGFLTIQSEVAFTFSSNTFITYAIEFSNVSPGIASTLAFGNATLNRTVSPVAIASTATASIDNELVHIIDYSSIASTAVVSANALFQITIDPASIASSANIGLLALFRGISPVAIASTSAFSNDNMLVHIIDYSSIASTATVSANALFQITIDPASTINVSIFGNATLDSTVNPVAIASTSAFSNDNMLVHIIDYGSIASTATVSANALFQVTIDPASTINVSIFGNATLDSTVNPVAITSTSAFSNNNMLVHIIDYSSIASTSTLGNGGELVHIIDPTSTVNIAVFGTSILDRTISANSVPSTLALSNNVRVAYVLGSDSIASTVILSNNNELVHIIDYSSIVSTVSISTDTTVELDALLIDPTSVINTSVFGPIILNLNVGAGRITNFTVNTIQDLSTEQIAKYGTLTIDTVPGNRIFDGLGTIFVSQLAVGNTITVIDVNNTNEEFILTVDGIVSNTVMSVTSNVLYSNSSLAIVSNAIFLLS